MEVHDGLIITGLRTLGGVTTTEWGFLGFDMQCCCSRAEGFGCNSGGREEGRKEGNGGEELSWSEGERGEIFFATAV